MARTHRMECTAGPTGLVWECADGCGRRAVVDVEGDLTIIDHGDRSVLHHGSSGGVRAESTLD